MFSDCDSKSQTETHFNTYKILIKGTYATQYFEGYLNELLKHFLL